jgi:ankyrin repeat protein
MDAKEYFSDKKDIALAEAAARGDLAGIQRAIAAGANVNAMGREDMTPLLFVVASTKNPNGIKALIEAGADAGHVAPGLGSVVTLAASAEDPRLLRILLDSGADPNSRNADGEPAAITAAMHSNFPHLQMLLDSGADINLTDAGGDTVAITLASLNQYEQVAKLIGRGADIRHVANNGQTIANTLERNLPRMDPKSSNFQWANRVKQMLIDRGATFPAPTALELRPRSTKPH